MRVGEDRDELVGADRDAGELRSGAVLGPSDGPETVGIVQRSAPYSRKSPMFADRSIARVVARLVRRERPG